MFGASTSRRTRRRSDEAEEHGQPLQARGAGPRLVRADVGGGHGGHAGGGQRPQSVGVLCLWCSHGVAPSCVVRRRAAPGPLSTGRRARRPRPGALSRSSHGLDLALRRTYGSGRQDGQPTPRSVGESHRLAGEDCNRTVTHRGSTAPASGVRVGARRHGPGPSGVAGVASGCLLRDRELAHFEVGQDGRAHEGDRQGTRLGGDGQRRSVGDGRRDLGEEHDAGDHRLTAGGGQAADHTGGVGDGGDVGGQRRWSARPAAWWSSSRPTATATRGW